MCSLQVITLECVGFVLSKEGEQNYVNHNQYEQKAIHANSLHSFGGNTKLKLSHNMVGLDSSNIKAVREGKCTRPKALCCIKTVYGGAL